MIPVVTPEEMKAIDAAAPEPVDVLIERAGRSVAAHALDILGGVYGRRVVVVAGKGNNGADGRVAAGRLAARGVRVTVFDAADAPRVLPACDLVIDAAYGTGFRGEYNAPDAGDAFVLAVDMPSGLDGLTGRAGAGAVRADATVTFAALKPGLLYDRGAHAGVVLVADIGLDVSGARAHLVEPRDVAIPPRADAAHKYASAVGVVAGSPGMTGAPVLVARAAFRAGAGYVRLAVPGVDARTLGVTEAVGADLPMTGWAPDASRALDRMKAAVVGPGLGRSSDALGAAEELLRDVDLPCVVDGDGLRALPDGGSARPRVLTPHEGEYEHLAGSPVGDDRLSDTRALAEKLRSVVLLKGPTTVVATPEGEARFSMTGSPRLATAGTGDVLSGVIAALLARGLAPLEAASLGACAHGLAARRAGRGESMVASDLLDALPEVLWPVR